MHLNCAHLPSPMQLSHWLQSHGVQIGDQAEDSTVLLITDGHVPIRNVLHAEAACRGIDPSIMSRTPWCCYIDLTDWCYRQVEKPNTISSDGVSPTMEMVAVGESVLECCWVGLE